MPFTNEGYKDWCRFHCTLLMLDATEYHAALAEWEYLFRRLECTVEELDLASEYILSSPERAQMPWRAHFGTIRSFILRRRTHINNEKTRVERERRYAAESQESGDPDKPSTFAEMLAKRLPDVGKDGDG